jgi:peptidase C39-like protein
MYGSTFRERSKGGITLGRLARTLSSRVITRRLRGLAVTLIAAGAIESLAVRVPWLALRVLAFSHGAAYIDQGDVIRQRSTRDCGVAALAMMLAHYERGDDSLDSLRALIQRRQRGLSFAELQSAAAAYALSARGWILPASQLGAVTTPAIVHFPNHYVVLDSIRQRSAYLRDPAIGRVRMKLRVLAWRSTGRVLVFGVNSIDGLLPSYAISASTPTDKRGEKRSADGADAPSALRRCVGSSASPATRACRHEEVKQ